MKLFFFFFVYFFSFQTSVFAQGIEVLPNQLPSHSPPSTHLPGYCLFTFEILAPSEDIYICNYVTTTTFSRSNGDTINLNSLYSQCWSNSAGTSNSVYSNPGSGIALKKQVFATLTKPESYDFNVPCKLKSEAEPDQICNQPLNVNSLVRSVFGQRFPLDLFEGFQPPVVAASCPIFTITGQTFQLCYLNNLVASLKYVLLVVFIISSVMSL
jgi:hypothetical protein